MLARHSWPLLVALSFDSVRALVAPLACCTPGGAGAARATARLPLVRLAADEGQMQSEPPSTPRHDGTCVAPPTSPTHPALAVPEYDAETAQQAEALFQRAKRLQQTRQFEAAVSGFKELAALTPADGRVWMRIASMYKEAGRFVDAEAVLRQGVAACPENVLLIRARADVLCELKRYVEARQAFQRALTLDSVTPFAYDAWARMEMLLGRYDEAEALFRTALASHPTAILHHGLGVLQFMKLGQPDRARETLLAGLRLPNQQKHLPILHALANLETTAGNYPVARRYLHQIFMADPTSSNAYMILGRLEEGLRRYASAVRAYQLGATNTRGGSVGPVALWTSWARAEILRGRRRDAVRVYERAIRHFPNHPSVLADWGRLMAADGDVPAGRRILARLLSPQNRPPPYAFKHAIALEVREGDMEAARALYSRAVSELVPRLRAGEEGIEPGLIPLVHSWAVFEWRHGDVAAARSIFRKAEELSTSPCAWMFMWRANYETKMGNVPLARHYYARAVSMTRDDPVLWRLWAEMERAIGIEDRAELYSQKATSIQALQTINPSKELPKFARKKITRVGAWGHPPRAAPEVPGEEEGVEKEGGEAEGGEKLRAAEAGVQGKEVVGQKNEAVRQGKEVVGQRKGAVWQGPQAGMQKTESSLHSATVAAAGSDAMARTSEVVAVAASADATLQGAPATAQKKAMATGSAAAARGTVAVAPDSKLVAPDSELVALDSKLVDPDSKLVAPDSELVAPDSELVAPDSELVVPDSELAEREAAVGVGLPRMRLSIRLRMRTRKARRVRAQLLTLGKPRPRRVGAE